jgi:hypothetical protein
MTGQPTIIRRMIPIRTILNGGFKKLEEYPHLSSRRMTNKGILSYQRILKDDFGKIIEPDTIILSTRLYVDTGSVHAQTLLSIYQSHVSTSLELFYMKMGSIMMTTVSYQDD